MNLTTQVFLVLCILLAFEVGLLAWLGSLLKHAESQIEHERKVLETIDHLERLSVLREKATSGLLQQQMFLKDEPASARYKQTFGQYIEQIPVQMRTVLQLVQDDPEVANPAKELQRVLAVGVEAMKVELDYYLRGQDDALLVMKLNKLANSASQLTQQILDHYRNLEQDAVFREGESRANLQAAFFVAVGLNILTVLALGLFFTRGIIKRLKIVTENSQKLALGTALNEPMSGNDEIATLDHVFHYMADALNEAAHKERAIVENAVDVICSIDSRLRFAAVNPASRSVLGYSPDDLIGKNMLTIVAPDHVEKTRTGFENILKESAKSEFETVLVTQSGAHIDVACSARWSPQEKAIFCVLHDISQAKEMSRLKQEFTAMVSHDLRTPLSSLHGILELLIAGVYDSKDEIGKNRLQKALGSLNRLLTLVNDLLDVEKLEAGKMKMDLHAISISTAVRKSIDAVAGYAENHKVRVISDVPEISVTADEDRLIQVFVNLLSNAIKFSPPNSTVQVTATLGASDAADSYCEVKISDQGRGIPPEQVPFLFERFRQTEKTDGKRGVGTGLGMAICKAIVEGHEGSIGATSEVGKGTTIWLRLPRAITD
ncbi:MAG TPA: ATP-binding protein [Drouetiella sp.]|jgi:PAS domain S-box-containing protein